MGKNPTDRGKQGCKRSLLVDGNGLPLALEVAPANRHDMKLLATTLESVKADLPEPSQENPQNLCLDGGFDYDECRNVLEQRALEAHIVPRSKEARLLKEELERPVGYRARRWVVERTHSWMNRYRRLLIRWEKKADNYLGFVSWLVPSSVLIVCLYSDRLLVGTV
jgi:putative transposase